MTMAPVRPIFQNGQRLTAERLTQALEFLRTMIRRILLAPLSAGVAEGFELTPIFGEQSPTLTVAPGLGIDGRGRLLVVPEAHTFTTAEILNAIGSPSANPTPTNPLIVRVCLALDDSHADNDPCSPYRPLSIEEDVRFIFQAEDPLEFAQQVVLQFRDPNCVASWDDLDQPPTGTAPCCVTLGHVTFTSTTELTATTFFRQGVCPRFNVIRNTDGEPSIYLDQIEFDGTALGLPSVNEPGVGIPVTTLFGPKPVVVNGPAAFFKPTAFREAGGLFLQASHISPFGATFAAGQYSGGPLKPPGSGPDPRVFEFAGGAGVVGGTNEIPAELAGVSAIPCELNPGGGDVTRSGVPLAFDPTGMSGSGAVRVVALGGAPETIGLSAGAAYAPAIHSSKKVVPLATAGLVQAQVEHDMGGLAAGKPLTTNAAFRLKAAMSSTDMVVARLAQTIDGSLPSPTEALVWVVNPALRYGS